MIGIPVLVFVTTTTCLVFFRHPKKKWFQKNKRQSRRKERKNQSLCDFFFELGLFFVNKNTWNFGKTFAVNIVQFATFLPQEKYDANANFRGLPCHDLNQP